MRELFLTLIFPIYCWVAGMVVMYIWMKHGKK